MHHMDFFCECTYEKLFLTACEFGYHENPPFISETLSVITLSFILVSKAVRNGAFFTTVGRICELFPLRADNRPNPPHTLPASNLACSL